MNKPGLEGVEVQILVRCASKRTRLGGEYKSASDDHGVNGDTADYFGARAVIFHTGIAGMVR